jgi:filamentous hemagglutinin family protein
MKKNFEHSKSLLIATLLIEAGHVPEALANPTGLNVGIGNATAQQIGSQLNVTVGQAALLNWNSFNIGAGQTTTFFQPSANSVVLNVIGDRNPSQIFGNLNANGTVILANANGFYFGPDSMVRVGGSFIATTAPTVPDFGGSAGWQFTGMPPLASIVNYGQIQVGTGKSLYLIAEKIENHGTLAAPQGEVELAGGSSVLVSQSADGRGLSASVRLPSGSVDNFGRITADAGTIALQAQVVNQDGIIQADSIREKNGVIELIAADSLTLGSDSRISARGDGSPGGSAGGTVTLKSENVFNDATGSSVITAGGVNGGNGGNIEVSAPNVASLNSSMDARANAGFIGGEFLLDPVNIILGTSGSGAVPGDGTVPVGGSPNTLSLNVNTAFKNKFFSSINLQASGNITLNGNTSWDLSLSTGMPAGLLTLQAGGDIIFNNGAKITDANSWGVTLDAGWNFANSTLNSGVGNIYLNGGAGRNLNGSIQTAGGDINLNAGNNILVGLGSVRTSAGGNISVLALAGDISSGTAAGGTLNSGYNYSFDLNGNNTLYPNGYAVAPNLGGISTMAGGNVALTAGGSINPSANATTFGISGAFGSQPGNVTLSAGSLVQGNFNVANGTGTILSGVQLAGGQPQISNAGANAGSSAQPLTLGLIAGSWNVWAANNVFLNEVRNPNGTFNSQQVSVNPAGYAGNLDGTTIPTQTSFLNNYALDAAVNIWGGNSINLLGANLTRPSSYPSTVTLPIYAPSLSLNAGAGGINFQNSIILAPSSVGSLSIVTRSGGNLTGAFQGGSLTGIIMSGSGLPQIQTYEQGEANTPLHLLDPNPVWLNISGSIGSFSLSVPTFASITVAGTAPFTTPSGANISGTYNFGFQGRNLSASQTTAINVTGDINYRGNTTAETLTEPLPPALLLAPADPALNGRLSYNPTTQVLTLIGILTGTDLAFLLNPTVLVFDSHGNPVLDQNGNQETMSVTLTAAQQNVIQQLYADSQSASLGDQGLAVAGPGNFSINARNIDLGVSGGISVLAPDSSLAAISPYGANLNITTLGNLEMTSTKISNESYHGGINLTVGGTLDVGGQLTTFGDPNAPKGIFTTSGGNISVTAQNDVNVDGSRIAAYNGGNIAVTSQTGNVNAGNGGAGFVGLNSLQLDPTTGLLTGIPATIPGSGILATTLFGTTAPLLGNITISAPHGSVNASLGGILQIAFNNANTRNNFIQIDAGHDINATGSGIIGSNIRLQAGGNINGVVVGSQSVNIQSLQNVDVTAVSGGSVNINASGSVSGTVVGGGEVSVSGDTIDASVRGGSVSTSGDTAGASLGVPASNVTKDNTEVADNANTTTAKTASADDEDPKKKRNIGLARKVSRVTVFLPTLRSLAVPDGGVPGR